MKRVLLLTYHVPPRPSVASVRVAQLMRVLHTRGWDVVAVTPDLGDARMLPYVRTTGVVDFKAPVRRFLGVTPAQSTHQHLHVERGMVGGRPSLAQRALRLGYEVTEYANRSFGWIGPGTRAISEMLRREHYDAVISTSPPETTHMVAARVHGKIPWIADLRDPWQREGMRARPAALTALDRVLEPRTLRQASALTTVSEPLAAGLRARYPSVPVYVVPNAFSEADWEPIRFVEPDVTRFLYAGQLYGGRCDPRPFFSALASLLHDGRIRGEEVHVDFYGDTNEWLRAEITRAGLGGIVTLHGRVPREEILRLERSASRLLLFLWNDPSERGTYTGKLFEYLGARRRIIAIGGPPETVIDDVLQTTGAGERYRTEAGLRDAIMQAVGEWRKGATPILDPRAVATYESEQLGARFAAILDELTRQRISKV